jgi:hypothetical protein
LHAGGLQSQIGGANAATYPLAVGLGSVRGITDCTGALTGTADYTAFGAVRSQSGGATIFGFTGEQTISATGLTFLRAQYADPTQGRFLSADSV